MRPPKSFKSPWAQIITVNYSCHYIIHTCTFFWTSLAREFSMNSRSSSDIFGSSAGELLTTRNHTMAHATPMEPVGKWNRTKMNQELHLFNDTVVSNTFKGQLTNRSHFKMVIIYSRASSNGHLSQWTVQAVTIISTSVQRPPPHNGNGQ